MHAVLKFTAAESAIEPPTVQAIKPATCESLYGQCMDELIVFATGADATALLMSGNTDVGRSSRIQTDEWTR